MADKTQNNPGSPETDVVSAQLEATWHWVRTQLVPQHGTKLMAVVVILVLGLIFFQKQQASVAQTVVAQREELGVAFDHLYRTQNDSAEILLEAFLSKPDLDPLLQAKAALLLGNLKYRKADFAAAQGFFQKAQASSEGLPLIESAAEHGLASVEMEQKNFEAAAQKWEAFVAKYEKRTGDLQARYAGEEPVNLVVSIPDALWKLTLCYQELQNEAKMKATAEKLVAVYGKSKQAQQAQKIL